MHQFRLSRQFQTFFFQNLLFFDCCFNLLSLVKKNFHFKPSLNLYRFAMLHLWISKSSSDFLVKKVLTTGELESLLLLGCSYCSEAGFNCASGCVLSPLTSTATDSNFQEFVGLTEFVAQLTNLTTFYMFELLSLTDFEEISRKFAFWFVKYFYFGMRWTHEMDRYLLIWWYVFLQHFYFFVFGAWWS